MVLILCSKNYRKLELQCWTYTFTWLRSILQWYRANSLVFALLYHFNLLIFSVILITLLALMQFIVALASFACLCKSFVLFLNSQRIFNEFFSKFKLLAIYFCLLKYLSLTLFWLEKVHSLLHLLQFFQLVS